MSRVLAVALLIGSVGCAPDAYKTTVHPALSGPIRETATKASFNGSILVAHGGQVLYGEGFGKANFGKDDPATPQTKYQGGSFSKWVASVVVLRLVDEGKLSLTAPISTYLPAYRKDTGAVLTLHALMSHTSGLPNEVMAALKKDSDLSHYEHISTPEAVARFASGDLKFKPGAQFDYVHSNWIVVEAIIEHATSTPYAQAVNDLLFKPLGLKNSGIIPRDFMTLPHAAEGYTSLTPSPIQAPRGRGFPFPPLVGPFGGYYADAIDVATLLHQVYEGGYLSASSVQKLWTVNVPAENYAYGGRSQPETDTKEPHKMSWNNNSNGPYKSLMVHTDDGWSIVILNNTTMDQETLNIMGKEILHAVRAD